MTGIPPSQAPLPLAAMTDAQLVALARDGDQLAFEQLVRRHHRRLRARARSVAPPDGADDALQNGLLSAWLALQRGTEVRDVRPWLERIVHNAALRARASVVCSELPDGTRAADSAEPATELERRQRLRDALSALSALPELQRQALLQTALEGQSYESTAQSLGINASTVRGLVSRARVSMRAAMGVFFPLPALSRLFARRGSAARHSASAAHTGSSAGVGTLAAKGAVALVVAGAGVGAAQMVGSHRGSLTPPTSVPVASRPGTVRAPASSNVLALRPGGFRNVVVHARHRPAGRRTVLPRVSHQATAGTRRVVALTSSSTTAVNSRTPESAPRSDAPARTGGSTQDATKNRGVAQPIQQPSHQSPTNSSRLDTSAGSTVMAAPSTTETSTTDTSTSTDTTSTTDTSTSTDTTSTTDTSTSTDTTSTTDSTSTTDTVGAGTNASAANPPPPPDS